MLIRTLSKVLSNELCDENEPSKPSRRPTLNSFKSRLNDSRKILLERIPSNPEEQWQRLRKRASSLLNSAFIDQSGFERRKSSAGVGSAMTQRR